MINPVLNDECGRLLDEPRFLLRVFIYSGSDSYNYKGNYLYNGLSRL